MSPPLGAQELDEKIEQLKKKEQEYIEEGDRGLKQEQSDLEALVEQEVDADLERERRAEEGFDDDDGYGEEDDGFNEEGKEAAASKGPRAGHRGNDYRGKKFGYGDDDYEDRTQTKHDPYTKPSRGGGQQVNQAKRGGKQGGKKKMEFDNDEDFPAL